MVITMLQNRNDLRITAINMMCVSLALLATGCHHTQGRSFKSLFSSKARAGVGAGALDATTDVQLALAQTHERKGEIEKAIDAYQGLADEMKVPLAMHRLGVLHDRQGNFDLARDYYSKALKHRPKDAELLCDMGYSYYLQENWKASESHLRRAVDIDPKLTRAHNNLGLLLARLDQPDAALAAFRNATHDGDVALANFNYVFHANQQTAPAVPTDGTQLQLVDVEEIPMKHRAETTDVDLSSMPTTTRFPLVHPLWIGLDDAEIESVDMASYSQQQSSGISNQNEMADLESQGSGGVSRTDSVESDSLTNWLSCLQEE
jgi:Tfp pilus assembly protein PilF